jgi:hypothetical protein
MQNLDNTVGSPHYFVFSDDIPWARQNITSKRKVTFMDHNDPKHEHLDFSLMSACKHHIIANSSFSWWAAWLNDHPYKIVIAPKKWFTDETMDSRDLIPHDWIVI